MSPEETEGQCPKLRPPEEFWREVTIGVHRLTNPCNRDLRLLKPEFRVQKEIK